MALEFWTKPTATLRIKSSDSDEMWTILGVTSGNTTPSNAANQVNKLLNIGGRSVVADLNMRRTVTEEVVDNG